MTNERKPKPRSRQYPSFGLGTCREIADKIHRKGGGIMTREGLAEILGMTVKSSSFRSRVSSTKQFNLISEQNERLTLTELAKKILVPISAEARKSALIEAFKSPKLYAKLVNRYNKKQIPKDTLANILYHEYPITESAKENAVKRFIESGEYAGVIQNDILNVPLEAEMALPSEKKMEQAATEEIDVAKKPDLISFTTQEGGRVEIRIFGKINEQDAKRIKGHIDLLIG